MADLPSRSERFPTLILPARQLNAALRKSAQRAQRLADAFGQQVPAAPEPHHPRATTTAPARAPSRRRTAAR